MEVHRSAKGSLLPVHGSVHVVVCVTQGDGDDAQPAEGADEGGAGVVERRATPATLEQELLACGLLEAQPSLRLLVPERAMRAAWLGRWLAELRERWGLVGRRGGGRRRGQRAEGAGTRQERAPVA